MENFDKFYSEMMKTTTADYAPLANGLRCFYLALIEEGFTEQKAFELCNTYLSTMISTAMMEARG